MPKKILLADDSITIQKVVELTFSDGDYEVTAVNNGAKAVQKLAEMRPDIILSDIIMPEKNGYEVCEYVKSHPEYRSIPVVLLTGTFEPFDPDRAEKAGCDAVVTKPFESQSLIHKVEELIAQARTAPAPQAAAPAPAPEPAASPWLDETPAPPPPAPAPPAAPVSPFSTATEAVPALNVPFTHESDIFGAPPSQAGSADMPFETPADLRGGTSADLRGGTSADLRGGTSADLRGGTSVDQAQEPPFGAPPDAEAFSGETRAFTKMSFDDLQQMASAPAPQPEPVPQVPPPAPEPSPWDEPAGSSPFTSEPASASPFGAEPEYSGETRAFQTMNFEEMNRLTPPPSPPPAPAPETEAESPFGAPPDAEAFSGETRAFTKMSFEDLQRMAAAPAPPAAEPEPPVQTTPEPSPWDEPAEAPAFSGETRAFPKMSFEDLQQMAASPSAPAWTPEEEEQPAPAAEPVPVAEPESPFAFGEPAAEEEATPFAASTEAAEPALEELPAPEPEQPSWTAPEPAAAAAPAIAPPSEPSIPISRELTDEQVDRIARRVVELMSDQVIRNIAWEVIPDLAEMVVKERIRQLESEA